MNDALSKYINTAIEIIVFALLLTIIVLFGSLARDALNNKVERNVIINEMNEERLLYKYTEISNKNGVVKGDDVVNFVTEFKRKYDIDIISINGPYNLDKTDVESDMWEVSEVLQHLDKSITNEFYIKRIDDEDRQIIEKFIFRQK